MGAAYVLPGGYIYAVTSQLVSPSMSSLAPHSRMAEHAGLRLLSISSQKLCLVMPYLESQLRTS